MSLKARCPECQRRCPLKAPPRPGLRFMCAGCHAQLEVVEINPLVLESVHEAAIVHRRPRRPSDDED